MENMEKAEVKKLALDLGRAMQLGVSQPYEVLEWLVAGAVEERRETETPRGSYDDLAQLRALELAVDDLLRERVEDARGVSMSWEKIANALEVTRQTVWRKYRDSGSEIE